MSLPSFFRAAHPLPAMAARFIVALAFAASPLAHATSEQPAPRPEQFALRLPLTVVAGSTLQRLRLPAAVLVRLQEPGLADLRIYDAAGQAVPVAVAPAAPPTRAAAAVRLPAYPLAERTAAAAAAGLSLRIDEHGADRRVQLDVPAPAAASSSGAAAAPVTGALVDTRALREPVGAVRIDADIPPAVPVPLQLSTSTDLQHWQPLASTVLYRSPDAGLQVGPAVEWAPRQLQGQYLRIDWAADLPGAPAVRVRAVELIPAPQQAAPDRPSAMLQVQRLDAHEWRFAAPFATPLAQLLIESPSRNSVVPVTVLGRQQPDAEWTPIASTVVFDLEAQGQRQRNGPVALDGQRWRELRIRADAASSGFATAPVVQAWLEPQDLVFAASGTGPWTLAAGRARTPPQFLAVDALVPDYQPGAAQRLPPAGLAQPPKPAGAASQPPLVPTASLAQAGEARRRAALWAILVAGVATLGAMAWRLARPVRSSPASPPADPPRDDA